MNNKTSLTKKETQTAMRNALLPCNYEQTDTNTDYHIDYKDRVLTVSIQGSVDVEDWIQNFTFKKHPIRLYKDDKYKWVYVHLGFYLAWVSISDNVKNAVVQHLHELDKIILTGYSHGAGVASVGHVLLKSELYPLLENVELYSPIFGTPRAWGMLNHKWIMKFVDKLIRIENSQDLVTRVPYIWLFYKHIGKVFHIGKPRLLWAIFGNFSLDHMLSSERGYLKSIENLKE